LAPWKERIGWSADGDTLNEKFGLVENVEPVARHSHRDIEVERLASLPTLAAELLELGSDRPLSKHFELWIAPTRLCSTPFGESFNLRVFASPREDLAMAQPCRRAKRESCPNQRTGRCGVAQVLAYRFGSPSGLDRQDGRFVHREPEPLVHPQRVDPAIIPMATGNRRIWAWLSGRAGDEWKRPDH
jgi:hypothetical protein